MLTFGLDHDLTLLSWTLGRREQADYRLVGFFLACFEGHGVGWERRRDEHDGISTRAWSWWEYSWNNALVLSRRYVA